MADTSWANLEIFTAIAVAGLAAILAGVSLFSYARLKRPRALFIGLGFLSLAGQGGYLISQAYRLRGSADWLFPVAGMALLALIFLYLALRIR